MGVNADPVFILALGHDIRDSILHSPDLIVKNLRALAYLVPGLTLAERAPGHHERLDMLID